MCLSIHSYPIKNLKNQVHFFKEIAFLTNFYDTRRSPLFKNKNQIRTLWQKDVLQCHIVTS